MLWQAVVLLCLHVGGIAGLDNGLVPTPPMGWLTWQRFRCESDCNNHPDTCISERLIREMADAMVSEGYADLGYEYVIIDDCWSTHERAEDGSLVPDPIRFSSGIAALADYVHGLGLKFGIYGDVGTHTCGGYPGSQDYYEIDAKTFAKWGVDYVKIDGCNIDSHLFDQKYPEFVRAVNATGRPIVFSCEWPLYQTLTGIEPNYTAIAQWCNVWRNFVDVDDYYESFKNIFNWHGDNQDKFTDFAGPGAWNDPDMLVVGNFALSFEQSKAQMAAWAVMASPLIMSNDLRKMDPQMKAILQNKDVIAINQDRLTKQGRRVYNNNNMQIWVRTVEPVVNGANSYAVLVLSTFIGGSPSEVSASLESIGVNSSDSYTVTELFGALPTTELKRSDTLKVQVPPTGALFFKFTVKS